MRLSLSLSLSAVAVAVGCRCRLSLSLLLSAVAVGCPSRCRLLHFDLTNLFIVQFDIINNHLNSFFLPFIHGNRLPRTLLPLARKKNPNYSPHAGKRNFSILSKTIRYNIFVPPRCFHSSVCVTFDPLSYHSHVKTREQ